MLIVRCCLLFVVCMLRGRCCLKFVARSLPRVARCLVLFGVCCLLRVVCCLLCGVCCSLRGVCRLSCVAVCCVRMFGGVGFLAVHYCMVYVADRVLFAVRCLLCVAC